MTEHTPTPWRVIAGDDYYITADAYPKEFIGHFKSDDTGDYLAWVGNRPADFGEANAAYIVKACNAFPDLVKALEQIAAIDNKEFGPDWEEIEEARKIANDVLGRVKSPSEPLLP